MPEHPRRHLRPVEVDPVPVVAVGVALWSVLLIVAVVMHRRLHDAGHDWWISAAAAGVALGLLGAAYCLRRRARLRRDGTVPGR